MTFYNAIYCNIYGPYHVAMIYIFLKSKLFPALFVSRSITGIIIYGVAATTQNGRDKAQSVATLRFRIRE